MLVIRCLNIDKKNFFIIHYNFRVSLEIKDKQDFLVGKAKKERKVLWVR